MKRFLFGAILVGATATVAFAPAAFAHGGQFRGPTGSVPSGGMEPSDPTPPAPPTDPSPPTTPPDPTTPQPTPTTPGTPPPTTPGAQPPVTGETPGGRGRATGPSLTNWMFWWGYNNDEYLNLKYSIYSIKRTSASPLSPMGGASGGLGDATRATKKLSKEKLAPFFREIIRDEEGARVLKPGPDQRSAASIGLAKILDDYTDVELIMGQVLTKDGKKHPKASVASLEGDVFALGLTARADKADQLEAARYDEIRDFLFGIYTNDAFPPRTRCLAMIGIGNLGFMPSTRSRRPATGGGLFHAPAPEALAQVTSDRIVDLLKVKFADPQFYACLLLALGMQPPPEVEAHLPLLKEIALKGRIGKDPVDDVTASYAALALGKAGGDADLGAMVNAMTAPTTGLNVKRSAAIAAGLLGRRVDGASRATIATTFFQALEKVKDETARNFGIISLAYLLEADIGQDEQIEVMSKAARVPEFLLKTAKDGRYSERPYAALALGIVGRAIGDKPSQALYGEFRVKALDQLRDGLKDQKLDKRSRGAFAIALGLVKDEGAKAELTSIVADKSDDKELRGYACVALGMIGLRSAEIVKAIKDALKERSSEELRQQAAIGLGLLQSPDAVPTLLTEIQEADSQNVLGQVVLAISKIGDARAIPPLVEIARDTSRPDLTRALATAGLGLIGDLELRPTLSRLSKDINYRSSPDAINEALSIL